MRLKFVWFTLRMHSNGAQKPCSLQTDKWMGCCRRCRCCRRRNSKPYYYECASIEMKCKQRKWAEKCKLLSRSLLLHPFHQPTHVGSVANSDALSLAVADLFVLLAERQNERTSFRVHNTQTLKLRVCWKKNFSIHFAGIRAILLLFGMRCSSHFQCDGVYVWNFMMYFSASVCSWISEYLVMPQDAGPFYLPFSLFFDISASPSLLQHTLYIGDRWETAEQFQFVWIAISIEFHRFQFIRVQIHASTPHNYWVWNICVASDGKGGGKMSK